MVKNTYVPDRGDIVWLSLEPSLGHEQSGRRPALVLSPKIYNRKTGMAICCPATKSVKGYSFEVEILIGESKSAVLVDQIRALDWSKRKCQFILKISDAQLSEAQEKLVQLVKG